MRQEPQHEQSSEEVIAELFTRVPRGSNPGTIGSGPPGHSCQPLPSSKHWPCNCQTTRSSDLVHLAQLKLGGLAEKKVCLQKTNQAQKYFFELQKGSPLACSLAMKAPHKMPLNLSTTPKCHAALFSFVTALVLRPASHQVSSCDAP